MVVIVNVSAYMCQSFLIICYIINYLSFFFICLVLSSMYVVTDNSSILKVFLKRKFPSFYSTLILRHTCIPA